jgi:hypothetical protein
VLRSADFADIQVSGGRFLLSLARFPEGRTSFDGMRVSDGEVWFGGAEFNDGEVTFRAEPSSTSSRPRPK